MKEFRTLLQCFKNVDHTIESVKSLVNKGEIKSERLIALITTKEQSEHGLLPLNIIESVHEFDKLIQWKRAAGATTADIPEPQPGIDHEFDNANQNVNDIKAEL